MDMATQENEKTDRGNDSAGTPDAEAKQAPSGTVPGPAPLHREQLHRRVQQRLAALESARERAAGKAGSTEHLRAIETALQVAHGSMSGGWERVGQREASQLSLWLSSTETLVSA
jgi:hypothetical protein